MILKMVLNLMLSFLLMIPLFSVVNDPNISAFELNHDLKLISQWAYQWKMSFNPNPTKQAVQVFFSRKTSTISDLEIFFNNTEFESHFFLISKLNGSGIIKSFSRYLSIKTLEQI